MISNESHSKEWIYQKRRELGGRHDPTLIEKVIKALTLLEQLRLSGLDFIFKGGTALMLLLDRPLRFSIDIDIVLPSELRVTPETLRTALDKISASGQFLRYEKDVRQQSNRIPKEHYKCYYHSIPNDRDDGYILLDVLYEDNLYPEIISRPIKSPLLENKGDFVDVRMPSLDGLLGDKLTAFAPKTTGIPYGGGKDLEIIKQLFDVAKLFEQHLKLEQVRTAFDRFVISEAGYRNQVGITAEKVLDDSFNTALNIALRGKDYPVQEFTELSSGIKKLDGYLFQEDFHIEHAINCAAKTACLSRALLCRTKDIVHFIDASSVKDLQISEKQFSRLNKLKKSDVEAFYYWHMAINLHQSKAVNS